MRRKSERAATKKAKSSPEKKEKVEKLKRTRTSRRRKQSTSSENDSADESSPVRETEVVVEPEKKTPQTPTKEESPEESQDRGEWHVKTAQSSSDTGEIQKLKICLTRPPSTPERTERSPRSKRKHSRATSSSDTASVEVVEEKKKSKHRSKRTTHESKDDTEKNNDSQGDEAEVEAVAEKSSEEISQSMDFEHETATDETPMSTTNEEKKVEKDKSEETQASQNEVENDEKDHCEETNESQIPDKSSDADTTVSSPKIDHQMEIETQTITEGSECKRSPSVEKSEVLEINVQESKLEISDVPSESQKDDTKAITTSHEKEEQSIQKEEQSDVKKEESMVKEKEAVDKAEELVTKKVSNEDQTDKNVSEEAESSLKEIVKVTNEHDVVASSETVVKKPLTLETAIENGKGAEDSSEGYKQEQIDSTQSAQIQQEALHNGQAAPIVINRKRRWGLRPNKLSSQKSITISTDVLKEIIPDVKPVEFEEVIEEKKNKRVVEKIERPVLPKIIIDNTEHAEQYRRENEEKDKENVKAKESYLAINRKISIVKENDNITARPPSPPRHKQSSILYITNLVRPFTLPQLKNLLQRTGKIIENGFWIDKIKSKCYIKYETEDQAVETRHALHGVTWPVSNPKTLQVDFSTEEAFEKAKVSDETESAPISTIPGTVEDWLREQDLKKERGEVEKPWERKMSMREWDVGKNDKEKEKDRLRRDERPLEKRRYRTPERSPEPARKFKKKEEEAPAKLLDDLFRKTKTTPCIYWLPLSAETIAIKEEQRRQHMAEHERRLQELRRERERRRH